MSGMQHHEGPTRTFQVSAAIGQFVRVRLSSGKLVAADADDNDYIGVTCRETFAADEYVVVRLRNAAGTHTAIANAAIAVGELCVLADDGEVGPASANSAPYAIALAAATADGDWIEVLPLVGDTGPVHESLTATGDGLTTGLIPAGADAVTVAAVTTDANDIITLPAIASVPLGKSITIVVGATGCELRTPATSGTTINNVDSDGTQEAALVATNHYICTKTTATGWVLRGFTNLGADVAAIVPD